jgi:hypothetical protein
VASDHFALVRAAGACLPSLMEPHFIDIPPWKLEKRLRWHSSPPNDTFYELQPIDKSVFKSLEYCLDEELSTSTPHNYRTEICRSLLLCVQ